MNGPLRASGVQRPPSQVGVGSGEGRPPEVHEGTHLLGGKKVTQMKGDSSLWQELRSLKETLASWLESVMNFFTSVGEKTIGEREVRVPADGEGQRINTDTSMSNFDWGDIDFGDLGEIRVVDYKRDPLFECMNEGDVGALEEGLAKLKEKGELTAWLNTKDASEGLTPLEFAITNEDKDTIALLLNSGASLLNLSGGFGLLLLRREYYSDANPVLRDSIENSLEKDLRDSANHKLGGEFFTKAVGLKNPRLLALLIRSGVPFGGQEGNILGKIYEQVYVEEVPAVKSAFEAKVNSGNEADRADIQRFLARTDGRLLAHRLSLKESEFMQVDGNRSENLEGLPGPVSGNVLFHSLQEYASSAGARESGPLSDAVDLMHAAFQNSYKSAEDFYSGLQGGGIHILPVSLNLGKYGGHAVDLVFCGKYILKCNRGALASKVGASDFREGIQVFEVKEEGAVNLEFIQGLKEGRLDSWRSIDEGDFFTKVATLHQKRQKAGNCTWASSKTALRGAVALQSMNKDLLSSGRALDSDFQAAFEVTRRDYKDWVLWDSINALKGYFDKYTEYTKSDLSASAMDGERPEMFNEANIQFVIQAGVKVLKQLGRAMKGVSSEHAGGLREEYNEIGRILGKAKRALIAQVEQTKADDAARNPGVDAGG